MHFLSAALPFLLLPLVSSQACHTHSTSPSLRHCRAALKRISPAPVIKCTYIFRRTYVVAEYGDCVIATYSESGNAHCIDGEKVIAAAKKVLAKCADEGKVEGTEGIADDTVRGVNIYGKP